MKEADLLELSRDAGILKVTPTVAYTAENETEVEAAIGEAFAVGLPVTPRGGGTSIPSQSVGSGAILLQARRTAEVRGELVRCEPGLVKADLNKVLEPLGRWVPVDPSSYANCTIGGMVANNSSGARTFKYGSTIDHVSSLRVAPPGEAVFEPKVEPMESALSGETRKRKIADLIQDNQAVIMQERPRVTKNSSGYRLERIVHEGVFDYPKLFIGSEGTLGVMTEATFLISRRPEWRLLFIVESSLEELDGVARTFRALSPSALELVDKSVFRIMDRWDMVARYSRTDEDYMVFCEFDGDGDSNLKIDEVASSKAGGFDPTVLVDPRAISEAWGVRNETLTLAQEIKKGTKILVPGVEDLVVPPERLSDLVKLLTDQFSRRGLEYISYGHAGDANLHSRPMLDISEPGQRLILDELMEDCFEAVWRLGGSMTGEHGDGMLRAKYVERQYPRTYWIMKEIKDLFDPKGMLNPGVKIFRPGQLLP